jgi:hypothetical protein
MIVGITYVLVNLSCDKARIFLESHTNSDNTVIPFYFPYPIGRKVM